MKSLRESLFDSDLITKNTTFGDLYELDDVRTYEARYPLAELYKAPLIMKDSKYVNKTDLKDAIVKGLTKIVCDIKLVGLSNHELNGQLKELEKYYKSIVRNTRYLHVRSFVRAYNKDSDAFKTNSINNWSLEDSRKVVISFCNIELWFVRK